MYLILQKIATRWTKQSRGMPHAAKRASFPKVMRLPVTNASVKKDANTTESIVCFHHVDANENDNFFPHEKYQQSHRSRLKRVNWNPSLSVADPLGRYASNGHQNWSLLDLDPVSKTPTLIFRQQDGLIICKFIWQKYEHYLPVRHPKTIVLTPEKTATLHINGKIDGYHERLYKQVIYNLAYSQTRDSDIFTQKPFSKTIDAKAHLF